MRSPTRTRTRSRRRQLRRLEDHALMDEMSRGHVDALGELVTRHLTEVCTTARAICRDSHAGDDVAREVFIDSWTRRGAHSRTRAVGTSLLLATHRQASTRALLHPRFAGLPEDERDVIVLARYGGLSVSQIAAELDVSPNVVKARMRHGLRSLGRLSG